LFLLPLLIESSGGILDNNIGIYLLRREEPVYSLTLLVAHEIGDGQDSIAIKLTSDLVK
jgi:hypothetical protein